MKVSKYGKRKWTRWYVFELSILEEELESEEGSRRKKGIIKQKNDHDLFGTFILWTTLVQ